MVSLPTKKADAPIPPRKSIKDFVENAADSTDDETTKLIQKSIRFHPDIIKTLNKTAKNRRKDFSDTVRDMLLDGFKANGIELES